MYAVKKPFWNKFLFYIITLLYIAASSILMTKIELGYVLTIAYYPHGYFFPCREKNKTKMIWILSNHNYKTSFPERKEIF